jgi:hypothetical protein
MLKRLLFAATVCLAVGAPCCAANLDAQLFPLTGEIRLRNNSAFAVPFVYYSIASASNALNNSSLVWKSITDNYDVSGNGFIDASFNWTKLSSASNLLTEGALSGPGGSLAAFRSVSLGKIWNPALYPLHDLGFTVSQADMSPVAISIQFAVAGDYNGNGTVEATDYNTWRQSYGSTTDLAADGNLNGVVDGADYVLWRKNIGQSLFLIGSGSGLGGNGGGGLGSGLQLGGAVPEPGTVALMLSAGLALLTARARAPRVARRAAGRFSARP